MWLDSDPGLGSTFYFVLEAGFESEAERIPPSVLDGVPVLIVDDNASSRQILARSLALEKWGQPSLALLSRPWISSIARTQQMY
jgi:hypothetical protein